ncbi:hypothetical protein KR059_010866, partial [Drosophila kikkawai]
HSHTHSRSIHHHNNVAVIVVGQPMRSVYRLLRPLPLKYRVPRSDCRSRPVPGPDPVSSPFIRSRQHRSSSSNISGSSFQ